MKRMWKLLLLPVVVLALAGTASANVPPQVPEIDPSMAGGALTLLIGGVLMLKGWRSAR